MERKILKKKLLAILLIISLLAADFCILSSNLMTYSNKVDNETKNPNVEFSAYFSEGAGGENIEKSIKSEELKLYAVIKVKNEGYLNEGAILEIDNSNFNIKNNITSSYINSISGNKVYLKQITAGEDVKIALDIEPIISEKIDADFLSKVSSVKLNGTYTGSTDSGIQEGKGVCITFKPDEAAKAELETDIITNKVLSVGETNKRIVQVLVKSRLADNQYPVKQTTINVDIPKLGEQEPEVSVLVIGKLATNGLNKIEETEYKVNDGRLQITLKNEADENNQISWTKDAYDEIVVTYIYPEDVDTSAAELNTDSEIKLQNSEKIYTEKYPNKIESKDTDGSSIIMGKTEITTKELYKGPIYANIETEYKTKTTIIIGNAEVAEEIIVKENADVFGTKGKELEANTKYKTTEIDLNKMLEILGQDGKIEIKNGETTTTINKDTKVNENGKVVINHENSAKEIEIKTSKPEKAGTIEIEHTKIIAENKYTREEIKNVKEIKATSTVTGYKLEEKVVENTTETASVELKETITKAELTIENNKQTLSTTEENEVILGITLITDGPQYDLYKNPEITIQLPAAVENVQLKAKPTKQNADEFEVSANYDKANKVIRLKLTGEQTAYPNSTLTQAYLQLNLNITLSKLATNQTDKITMTYNNKNASQYYGGTVETGIYEKQIEISAQPGLTKMFNLSLNKDTSLTQTVRQEITSENAGKTVSFETILVNNTDSDMNNVRILGKLPTEGNIIDDQTENTLKTILKNIEAPNATIYYTENANANINNKEDWSEAYTENAKMYLINLGTLTEGDNYQSTISVQMPREIEQGKISYTEYKVIYDTELTTNKEESSRKIALITSALQIDFTAQVGQEELKNGDVVKAGEVIKYIAKITNNTENNIENIGLNARVPNGTSIVEVQDSSEYSYNEYYSEDIEEEINLTIPTLAVGETFTTQYEVRVNTDITSGAEISNQIKVTYNDKTDVSTELTNKLENANVRVTIKKAIDRKIAITSGSEVRYDAIIENLSEKEISGLKLEIISDAFEVENNTATLEKIPAKGTTTFKIKGKIKYEANEMKISAIIKNENGTYRSNVIKEDLVPVNATIELTTPQNNKTLKEGDVVEYNISIVNTGSVSEYFKAYYLLLNNFEIQNLKINGITALQTNDETDVNTYTSKISNLIYEGMHLDAGGKGTITVTAKVKDVTETKVITNKARVEVLNVYKAESQEITHTLEFAQEVPDQPVNPDNPNTPDNPDDPENPSNPDDPNTPDNPNNPEENLKDNKIISGLVWIDLNRDGKKDISDKVLEGVKVKLYNVSTGRYMKDDNGNTIEATTEGDGRYTLSNIEKGSYIVMFEYDTEKYEPTIYKAEGTDSTQNSKAVSKKINIDGQEVTATVTDVINVQENALDINVGLKEKLIFDLELNKYISRVVVQTNKGTKTYDYKDGSFEKIEIHRKQISGALVVLEYTIKVKNTGEIAGYARNIVDYLPSGLTFSSELNSSWYVSDGYLYTKTLENELINPGEEKEIKLILTKAMTNENVGLINNRAEIYQDYNQYGEIDIDSTPNNQVQSEDDIGSADIIIMVATGGSIMTYIILMLGNILLIGVAIRIMIKNNIIQISIKRERR